MNNVDLTDDKAMADAFNECFASVFSPNSGTAGKPQRVFQGNEDDMIKTVMFPTDVIIRLVNLLQNDFCAIFCIFLQFSAMKIFICNICNLDLIMHFRTLFAF